MISENNYLQKTVKFLKLIKKFNPKIQYFNLVLIEHRYARLPAEPQSTAACAAGTELLQHWMNGFGQSTMRSDCESQDHCFLLFSRNFQKISQEIGTFSANLDEYGYFLRIAVKFRENSIKMAQKNCEIMQISWEFDDF